MANIIGINGNDTLVGTSSADTINGNGDNTFSSQDNDFLTGGGGKDKFVYIDKASVQNVVTTCCAVVRAMIFSLVAQAMILSTVVVAMIPS